MSPLDPPLCGETNLAVSSFLKYNEYSSDEEVYIFIKDLLELETDQKVSYLGLEEALWLLNESIYELSIGSINIESILTENSQLKLYDNICEYESFGPGEAEATL